MTTNLTLVKDPGNAVSQATAADLAPEILFQLITGGDCSKLSNEQKTQYYLSRCHAAGLDPRTTPFEYMMMNGKLVLYAKKSASEGLASNNKIVCEIIEEKTESGIRTVRVRSRAQDGRQTDDIGCVNVERLSGDALCNAHMKAVTKAKRRAILSLAGLGMTDETELETIHAPAIPVPALAPPMVLRTPAQMAAIVERTEPIRPAFIAPPMKPSPKPVEPMVADVQTLCEDRPTPEQLTPPEPLLVPDVVPPAAHTPAPVQDDGMMATVTVKAWSKDGKPCGSKGGMRYGVMLDFHETIGIENGWITTFSNTVWESAKTLKNKTAIARFKQNGAYVNLIELTGVANG